VVERHAHGRHVLLEEGGRRAVGLGGLEIVAGVEGTDWGRGDVVLVEIGFEAADLQPGQ
jgi:hypothetical protein